MSAKLTMESMQQAISRITVLDRATFPHDFVCGDYALAVIKSKLKRNPQPPFAESLGLVFGIPVKVDETVPRDEIHIRNRDGVVIEKIKVR